MEYFKTCVAPESLGYIMVGILLLVWGQRVIFPTTQYDTSGGWMQQEGPNVPSGCVWHLPKHQSFWTQYSPSADASITRWMGGWGANRLRMCMDKWKHSVIISAEVMRGAHGSSNPEHKGSVKDAWGGGYSDWCQWQECFVTPKTVNRWCRLAGTSEGNGWGYSHPQEGRRVAVPSQGGDGHAQPVTVSHFSLSLPPPRLIKALSLSPFHFRQGTYWRAWM